VPTASLDRGSSYSGGFDETREEFTCRIKVRFDKPCVAQIRVACGDKVM